MKNKFEPAKHRKFIEKAISIHGDKFDLSKTTYINTRVKVQVVCKEHAIFDIWPSSLLKGIGCPNCPWKGSMTTEEFIAKARKVHGDRYSYEKTKYLNNNRCKVIITCKIHGDFPQTADHHINGAGGKGGNCPDCAHSSTRPTLDEFIEKAERVHGVGTYDYTKVNYKDAHTDIEIVCRKHGVFPQKPMHHINSASGCSDCTGRITTTQEFIDAARQVHGDKYDYSKSIWVDTKTHIQVICDKHGMFPTLVANHVFNKHGCAQCAIESNSMQPEEFLELANKRYSNRYTYDLSNYDKATGNKIDIICPKHGRFKRKPTEHLRGKECRPCFQYSSKPENEWLDHLKIPYENRQVVKVVAGRKFVFDGFDPKTNTVYEFNGDYFHGNPKVFAKDKMNYERDKTFGELHKLTKQKARTLRSNGFKVISIWERDWNRIKKKQAKKDK